MSPYIRLFRPEMVIVGIVFLLSSAMTVSGDAVLTRSILLGALSVSLFVMGGNSLNDYSDWKTDAVSHPSRPIPSGKISRKSALYAGSALLVLSAAVAAFLPLISFVIVSAACVTEVAYELLLKQRGFPGNIAIGAVTGMTFLLGGSIAGDALRCILPSLAIMLLSVGREIGSDIRDASGDGGRRTLPLTIGVGRSALLASAFALCAIPISIVYYLAYSPGMLFAFAVLPFILIIETSRRIVLGKDGVEQLILTSMVLLGLAFGLGSL